MNGVVIEADNLTKIFRDGVVAVKDLDLHIKRGAVYGLLGRNGSGKTTALRLLMGCCSRTAVKRGCWAGIFGLRPARSEHGWLTSHKSSSCQAG